MFAFIYNIFVVVVSILGFVAYILLMPFALYLQRAMQLRTARFVRDRNAVNRPGFYVVFAMLATNLMSLSHSKVVPASTSFVMGGTPEHILWGWPFPWLGFPDMLSFLAFPITFSLSTLYWSGCTCMIFALVLAMVPTSRNKAASQLMVLVPLFASLALAYFLPAWLGPVV